MNHFNNSSSSTASNNMMEQQPQQQEMIMSSIAAMRRQEDSSGYEMTGCAEWYHPHHPSSSQQEVITGARRDRIAAWKYQLVDFLKLHRETVAISMSYLDRYVMATSTTPATTSMDLSTFQLAAFTSIYTAIKLHEPECMAPSTVVMLSKGANTVQQVEEMERRILSTLRWRMNPPTAQAFVRHLLDLIDPDHLPANVRSAVYDIARYQTEVAVRQCEFTSTKASTIAYCSLMNALETVLVHDAKTLEQYSFLFATALGMTTTTTIGGDKNLLEIQNALYASVLAQPEGTFAVVHQQAARPLRKRPQLQQTAPCKQQHASTACCACSGGSRQAQRIFYHGWQQNPSPRSAVQVQHIH